MASRLLSLEANFGAPRAYDGTAQRAGSRRGWALGGSDQIANSAQLYGAIGATGSHN